MGKTTTSPEIAAIDLFCGAGGLTNGLIKSGIQVVAGIDIDIDHYCKYPYEKNNSPAIFVEADVSTLTGKELFKIWPKGKKRLLAGCAPCQPFSNYSQGKDLSKDGRWTLLRHFARLIKETSPDYITMENVPQLERNLVLNEFLNDLTDLGYSHRHYIVNCTEIGIAQKRKRLVLIANRSGKLPKSIPSKKRAKKAVSDLIKNLEPLTAGESSTKDSTHRCASLSPLNLKRIRASKPGGTWKDWPAELRSPCHNKQSGDGYTAVYGRMTWNEPAPTMTTLCYNYGSGRFGHPEQQRPITFREAALLQSFPAKYKFEPPGKKLGNQVLGRLIGNAVPVLLGKEIGKIIINSR